MSQNQLSDIEVYTTLWKSRKLFKLKLKHERLSFTDFAKTLHAQEAINSAVSYETLIIYLPAAIDSDMTPEEMKARFNYNSEGRGRKGGFRHREKCFC